MILTKRPEKMRGCLKVKKIDITILGLFLALSKPTIIPRLLQQIFKIALLMGVMTFLISRTKLKKYVNVLGAVCLFMVISGITSYFGRVAGFENIIYGILQVACLTCIYYLAAYCKERNCLDILVKDLYIILSVFCILSIFSMAVKGHSPTGGGVIYLFGSKFMTSYYFIFWLTLYRLKNIARIETRLWNKCIYIILVVSVICICKWMYCTTAMLAVVFLLAEQFLPERIKKILFNRYSVLSLIILTGVVFPTFINEILSDSKVQHIIVDVLHKLPNMTGRRVILANIMELVLKRPWFGYGYGTTVMHVINENIDNAQNGLLQQMIQYGFVGGILFCMLVFKSLHKRYKGDGQNALYAALYAIIICSAVEISYNYIFYYVLFIMANFKIEPVKKEFMFVKGE